MDPYERLASAIVAQAEEDYIKFHKQIKLYNKKIANLKASLSPYNKDETVKKIKEYKIKLDKLEKELDDMTNADDGIRKYAKAQHEVDNLEGVEKYKKATETFSDLMKYTKGIRPHSGNIFARTLKTMKMAFTDSKQLDKARRVVTRGLSSKSSKVRTWLFDQTLKHGARLAKFEAEAGLAYTAIYLLGEMYDKTSTTSQEYSNGIQFKPFCLLAADDLKGYENVVNYGMWFMWVGASSAPEDDDAAYLEATDFASKFAYGLNTYMEDSANHIPLSGYCNVDIYVVRLIIQLDEEHINEDGRPTGKLFYLVMNDVPWNTNDAFAKNVTDIKKWEQEQKELEETDPKGKDEDPAVDKVMHEYGLDENDESATQAN